MSRITIQKDRVEKQKGVVILPIKEYQNLLRKAVPTFYLRGKAADELDVLVKEGLREHRAGRTRKIGSLADLE